MLNVCEKIGLKFILLFLVSLGLLIVPHQLEAQPELTSESGVNTEVVDTTPEDLGQIYMLIDWYEVVNNGRESDSVDNVKLTITLNKGTEEERVVHLPEEGQYWPIGNEQIQEINRVFLVPSKWVKNDSMNLKIRMEHKAPWWSIYRWIKKYKTCHYQVKSISSYNRKYMCHTNLDWQKKRGIEEKNLDRQGFQITIQSDKNTPEDKRPTQNLIEL